MNKFCRFLDSGVSIEQNKQGWSVRPCCWYDSDNSIDSLADIHLARNTYSDIQDWTPACDTCRKLESAGGASYRQASFDYGFTQGIGSVEIMLHSVCQAQCIICDENSSSGWFKAKQANGVTTARRPFTIDRTELEHLFAQDLSNLKQVKFWGGEPWLNTLHLDVLDRIPNKQAVRVHYTTSGQTTLDADALAQLEQFELVICEFSADSIEQQFEYLRYPIAWEEFVDNINYLRDHAPVNTVFRFNYTANPLNILYYREFVNWVKENFSTNRLGDVTEINVHPCWGNLDLNCMPASLKQELKMLYKDELQLAGLIELVQPTDTSDMIAYLDFWDSIRQKNWREVFPRSSSHFA